MLVSEVLDLSENFIGSKIMIEGLFVIERGTGYLCDNINEMKRRDRSILVNVKNLEARLLACVPPYGGGKYSYCDKAEISGILSSYDTGGFNFAIENVDNLIIYKYGTAIPVAL